MFAAIHRNSPRPVKVPRCHSDPPNPHLIIPTPEGFRYLALVLNCLIILWLCWLLKHNEWNIISLLEDKTVGQNWCVSDLNFIEVLLKTIKLLSFPLLLPLYFAVFIGACFPTVKSLILFVFPENPVEVE